MPTSARSRGLRSAPLRFVVWVLAVFYLGRIHYNNTLYDLRQIPTPVFLVRSGAMVVVTAFVYWNLAVVDIRILALIWGVVLVFVAKVLFVLGVIRIGTVAADRKEYRERRQMERRVE